MPVPSAPGETDLELLLKSMQPALHPGPFVIRSVSEGEAARLPFPPLCLFREAEGVTVIAAQPQAGEPGGKADPTWACITLEVHSSLQAVGFLAAIAGALAREGISVNPVSAYYHDHLFVPWERRRDALDALRALSAARK